MRLPLHPTPAFASALTLPPHTSSQPPLAFIDDEPFLIELQGSLEMPGGGTEGELGGMDGVRVGKLNLDEPHKPILQIAHHRLEGKLVTLTEPYALLRTTPASPPAEEPTPKRARLSSPPNMGSSPEKARKEDEVREPRIEIVGLVRRKIVFSKRPEPLITLSSDADMG